jgi:hypothetical protein
MSLQYDPFTLTKVINKKNYIRPRASAPTPPHPDLIGNQQETVRRFLKERSGA